MLSVHSFIRPWRLAHFYQDIPDRFSPSFVHTTLSLECLAHDYLPRQSQ